MKNTAYKFFVLLIMMFVLGGIFTYKTFFQKDSHIPPEVKKYVKENLPGYKFVTKHDLSPEIIKWTKDTAKVWLNRDFTGEGENDFIIILKDEKEMPFLSAFNNYATNTKFFKIKYVSTNGNVIGDFLYDLKEDHCFYDVKFESSTAKICWNGEQFEIEYVGD